LQSDLEVMAMRFALLVVAGFTALVVQPQVARAAATVIGGGFARACYEGAEFKRNVRESVAACDRALVEESLSAKDRAATYVNRGIVRMYERDHATAIADYDKALAIRADLAEAYVNKGIAVLHQGGNQRYAIELLSKGIGLDPARPEVAFYTRAVAHEQSGNTTLAYYDYKRAAEMKPDWEKPKSDLARFQVISD
jgi:tetratricopeptide (TPR) repeat protein